MFKNLILALAFCLVLPSAAHATDIPINSWNGPWDTIQSIYPADDGLIIILNNHTYAGHTGSCNSGRQFIVKMSAPNYEVKAKALLAAYLAGHQVKLFWTSSNTCRASVNRFQVIP